MHGCRWEEFFGWYLHRTLARRRLRAIAHVATMGWLTECRSDLDFSGQQRAHGSLRSGPPFVAESEFLIAISRK
jgi:hypothetical protein